MKRIVLLLTFLPSLAAAQIMLGQGKTIDGDTFVFGDEMVRIHGIDAVESTQSCERGGAIWACGEAATQMMRDLLGRGNLQCQQVEVDRYGRQVSTCRAGGRDIGQELVAAGLAIALRKYSDKYVVTEAKARAEGVGIWGGSFQIPSDYRAENPHFKEPRPTQTRPDQWTAPDYAPRQSQSRSGSTYFRNCDSARAAGAAPIRRGEPGYRSELDADLDGVACEPYRGRR